MANVHAAKKAKILHNLLSHWKQQKQTQIKTMTMNMVK
jgi:hypothetical protein